jgi:hypothetical protein
MSLFNGLISELQTLSSDSKRKNPEVRVASEEAIAALRALTDTKNNEKQLNISSQSIAKDTDMLRPISVAARSSNSQRYLSTIVAILYRLVIHNALPIACGSSILSMEKKQSSVDSQSDQVLQEDIGGR